MKTNSISKAVRYALAAGAVLAISVPEADVAAWNRWNTQWKAAHPGASDFAPPEYIAYANAKLEPAASSPYRFEVQYNYDAASGALASVENAQTGFVACYGAILKGIGRGTQARILAKRLWSLQRICVRDMRQAQCPNKWHVARVFGPLSRALVSCVVFALMLVATAHAATNDLLQSATIDGRTRQWLVHLPSAYRIGKPFPLVVAFHGHGSSAANMARLTKLDVVADRLGFIVVYAQGVDHSWAAGVDSPADQAGVNDVVFANALVDHLEREYSINTASIVFTGFSNGAHLVQWLGCRMAARLYAIVPVSGTLAPSLQLQCHPSRPLTVVAFHGTADPIDPYAGGHIRIPGGGAVLPVSATMTDWAAWDGCAPKPQAKDGTTVGAMRLDRIDWTDCRDGAHVTLYRINGGGHTWPGGPQYLPQFLIGKATHVIAASDVIGAIATRSWR
ncbi:MAG: alpha/beta hydrolase family esterase [Gammaproteobacteria bacterium]